MFSNTEHAIGPEDILEPDILPNCPKLADYQNIVTKSDSKDNWMMHFQSNDDVTM